MPGEGGPNTFDVQYIESSTFGFIGTSILRFMGTFDTISNTTYEDIGSGRQFDVS